MNFECAAIQEFVQYSGLIFTISYNYTKSQRVAIAALAIPGKIVFTKSAGLSIPGLV